MLLLPKYVISISQHVCSKCSAPILPGQQMIVFRFDRGTVDSFKHQNCVDGKTRIAQKASVRKRKKIR